ncbi:CinA family protein [Faecalimonas sp.]
MEVEEQVVEKLVEKNWKITTAESCTGGLLAGRILNVSGASSVYEEGHITYSNMAKEKILNVSHETLEEYGAVSVQTAEEMAVGAAKIANADVALSTTGIAGPTGGTKDKPVGLIYVSCYILGNVYSKELHLKGSREENRAKTVEEALELFLENYCEKRK